MNEILVSASTSPLPPAIAGNGASDFVVIWNDLGGVDLKGKIIRARGVTTGEEFKVNTTAGTHTFPAVAMMAGFAPGFAVAWAADGPMGRNVLLQRFAPDGTKTGPEIRVNTTDVNAGHRPAIARLPDLSFVVCWVSANLQEGIRGRIFRPDGTASGDEFRVNTSDGVHFGRIGIATLENNSFVVAWRGGSNFASAERTARLQIFDPTGSKVGPEIVPNFVGFTGEMAITFINNPNLGAEPGHFVIAHISDAGGGEERFVNASLFGPDGDMRVTFSVTRPDDHSIGSQLAVAAMPGQRFMVAWTDQKVPHVGDTTGRNIKAMPCSETEGALIQSLVPAIPVSASEEGEQSFPCVVTIVDDLGEVTAIGWVDDSVSGASSSRRAVKVRVLSNQPSPP
jgi:hypothetical protein